jgi:hypothetical protein
MRKWIMNDFKQRKKDIKRQLQESKSSIHLSFNLWTSPNHFTIVGIIAHFMNIQYKIESVLLGLRRLYNSHSGENVAGAIVSVIDKYEIAENIEYMMLDNTSLNDTCVEEILRQLDINDTKEQRRLRCLGHIINLTAKTFLFGLNANAFERKMINSEKIEFENKKKCEKEEEKLRKWRAKGFIGKLHNIIVYIRNTP